MPVGKWVALLAIAHRFRFIEAEYRARREVFERSISLDAVSRISLAEKYSVPTTFVVPALEELVRRPQPLLEREIAHMSSEMCCASLCFEGEIFAQSSRLFASETWLKRVARDIVKQLWPTEDVLISAVDGQVVLIRFFSCMRIQQHVLYSYRTNGSLSFCVVVHNSFFPGRESALTHLGRVRSPARLRYACSTVRTYLWLVNSIFFVHTPTCGVS